MAPRQVPLECFCCGETNPWEVKPVDFVAPFRDTQHSFVANVNQCRNCDAISPSSEQSDAISAEVRKEHVRWISRELTKAREELGLTIDGFVSQTGMPRATVARASSGESLIDASTEQLLWSQVARLRNLRYIRQWTTMQPQALDFSREVEIVPRGSSQSGSVRNYRSLLNEANPSSLTTARPFLHDLSSVEESSLPRLV
jgi:hypothetical protein